MNKIERILQNTIDEIDRSNKIHENTFNSTHEWYGILKEEIDELWDEIKKNKSSKEITYNMRKESIQIIAVVLKGLLTIPYIEFK